MMFYGGAITQNSLSTVLITDQNRAMNMDTFGKVSNSTHLQRLGQHISIIPWEK